MTKLSDIQIILLSTASQRPDGNLLPVADSIREAGGRIQKSLSALLKHGFAEEVEVTTPECSWREEGERRLGLVITSSGHEAIGIQEEAAGGEKADREDHQQPAAVGDEQTAPAPTAPPPTGATATRTGSKQALVIDLLRREGGATVTELVEATGWLSHTTRAALTGLRKKGHTVAKSKRGDLTCYSITEAR